MRNTHRILVVVIALVCVGIYLYTAAPFMLWQDAPRFVAAIVTLGIGDPAEPVYVFLAHWFTYLPFGSVIFRIQIFSALLAGASLLLLYKLVIRVLRTPKQLPTKNRNQPNQHFILPNRNLVLLAGIFSMLILAFSYEFWSQAQNVETFILDCFIELVVLNLLLSELSYKTVFAIMAVIVFICGVATGTDPPVIASVFPLVLLVAWQWRVALGYKRLGFLFLFGIAGIVLAWSLLAIMELHNPLLNDANGLSLSGIWSVATGQGKNVYAPGLGIQNGLTWSPIVMLQDSWHYLVILWMNFTPFLLPVILAGGIYLYRAKRRIFFSLFLVVITNFILCSLYHSGNEEGWALQSDAIFAIFAGVGSFWLIRILAAKWPGINIRLRTVAILLLAFIPLVWWWPTLDRRNWNFTQDYIDNLYGPLKGPAILVGSGDLWEAVSEYVYDATNYKSEVVPVFASYFYAYDWRRQVLVQRTNIKVPDTSHLTHDSPAEYSKFMNDFFALNLPKFRIYVNQSVFRDRYFNRSKPSFQLDTNRYAIIPVGMVEEIVPKNEYHDINLNTFVYHFGNGFPKTQPYFLERTSTGEMRSVTREMALSYDVLAKYDIASGQMAQAISFYQKAISLDPKNSQVLADLGVFYGQQNDNARALTYFQKAHDIEPDDQGFLYDLAIARGAVGEIDKEKQDLEAIINNPQSDTTLEQHAAQRLNSLNQQVASPSAGIPAPTMALTAPHGWNPFANTAMNIGFAYPPSLQLTQLDPQTVALSDPSYSAATEKMLIYSTTGTTINTLHLPFPVTGTKLQSQNVSIPKFTGTMEIYTAPYGIEQLLFLQRNQQIFVIRFPANKSIDPSIVSGLVNTITTLH